MEKSATASKKIRPFRIGSSGDCIKAELRSYQVDGVNWILKQFASGVGGILAGKVSHAGSNKLHTFDRTALVKSILSIITFRTICSLRPPPSSLSAHADEMGLGRTIDLGAVVPGYGSRRRASRDHGEGREKSLPLDEGRWMDN